MAFLKNMDWFFTSFKLDFIWLTRIFTYNIISFNGDDEEKAMDEIVKYAITDEVNEEYLHSFIIQYETLIKQIRKINDNQIIPCLFVVLETLPCLSFFSSATKSS